MPGKLLSVLLPDEDVSHHALMWVRANAGTDLLNVCLARRD